jgi:uncharacterized protein (UPF0332 family)
MNVEARDLWNRAQDALRVAKEVVSLSPDSAAASAYYAAFYAVSAHFALAGRTFRKHAAIDAAVHRDLVKGEGWPARLGSAYRELNRLRDVGHYGGSQHVPPEEAKRAFEMAAEIVRAVAALHPDVFSGPEGG